MNTFKLLFTSDKLLRKQFTSKMSVHSILKDSRLYHSLPFSYDCKEKYYGLISLVENAHQK
jgi:hypothetical protein